MAIGKQNHTAGFHVLDLQDDATSLQILPALEVDGEPAYELLASCSLASGHHLTFHAFLLHQNHGRIEVRHVFRMAPVGFYFGFHCFRATCQRHALAICGSLLCCWACCPKTALLTALPLRTGEVVVPSFGNCASELLPPATF